MKFLIQGIVIFSSLLAASAYAASFDCQKAVTGTEKRFVSIDCSMMPMSR